MNTMFRTGAVLSFIYDGKTRFGKVVETRPKWVKVEGPHGVFRTFHVDKITDCLRHHDLESATSHSDMAIDRMNDEG